MRPGAHLPVPAHRNGRLAESGKRRQRITGDYGVQRLHEKIFSALRHHHGLCLVPSGSRRARRQGFFELADSVVLVPTSDASTSR